MFTVQTVRFTSAPLILSLSGRSTGIICLFTPITFYSIFPVNEQAVKGVSIQDIRRLAKDQVMAARKKVGGLKAEELGFATDINVKYLNIYDHLTPRLQALYHEAKKVKEANKYKFCWAKNGFVYLRKSGESTIYKFTNLSELNKKFSTASETGVNDHLQS